MKKNKETKKPKLFLHSNINTIWFSLNENEFLPPENILRLINFRTMNPESEITFIYSAQLLNERALSELINFSSLYNIFYVDINDVITSYKNIEEYNEEFLLLIEGTFNTLLKSKLLPLTAALSDLVRIIASERFGIYMDFDILYNTRLTNKEMEVSAPFVTGYNHKKRSISNDLFAIPTDKDKKITKLSKEKILKLQNIMVENYKSFETLIYSHKLENSIHRANSDGHIKRVRRESGAQEVTSIEAITLKIALDYYSKICTEPSLLNFFEYLDKNLSKEMLKKIIEDLTGADGYTVHLVIEDQFDKYRQEILKRWVMHFSGTERYIDFIDQEKDIYLYDKSYNKLNHVNTQLDKIVDKTLFGDESWLDIEESCIIKTKDGQDIFAKLLNNISSDFHFSAENILELDYKRYIYEQEIRYSCYKKRNNSDRSKINLDLWYTGDQINNLLSLQLQGDQFYIAPQTQNGHDVTIHNIAQAITNAMDGRVSLVPILVNNNHWISLAIRQDSDGHFDVIFVDSLGNNFSYYNTQVISQVLGTLTHSNFNIIDASTYKISQQSNFDDCGVWTVANLVNIGRYLSNTQNTDIDELFLEHLDRGNALALREYYNNLDNEILYEAPIAPNITNNQENTTTIPSELSINFNGLISEFSDLIKEL